MPTYISSILRALLGRRGLRSVTAALTLLAATLIVAVPGASAHTVRHHAKRAHAAQGCANADTPAVGASTSAIQAAVVCLINVQRISRHLPALTENSRLDRSAQGWTNTMIRSGAFWHGANFATRITAVGFDWSQAGENIATGFTTPRSVVNAWMGSTGHCQNILDPSFSDVGTGVGRNPAGKASSGGAAWTQDFGLPMGQRLPSTNSAPSNGCPY
jgi:uncharacterized protein YkwD